MIENLIKVKDHPGLYRDPVTKAIIVDDPAAKKSYQTQRNILQKSLSSTEELKDEINIMREEINSMRAMLIDVVKHIKNN